MKRNLAVLVSGGGTNLQAIIDAKVRGEISGDIACVISDRPGVYALERAKMNGIEALCVCKKDYPDAQAFHAALLGELNRRGVEAVALAGFFSILPGSIIARYQNAILNVHPALIPSFCGKGYYGLKVHQAVLDYGCKVTGATVHLVDEGTDTGPIVLQACCEVLPGDTPEALQKRVMQLEHVLLPRAVELLMCDKIKVRGRMVEILP